jgi:D-lactate dehydrogenase (cytochrome)
MTDKTPPPPNSPFLRDESRFQGWAEDFKSPTDHKALVEMVGSSLEKGLHLTCQGARTGLCGAGVPQGGLIVNTSQLDKPIAIESGQNGFEIYVQPGYRLGDLKHNLSTRRLDLIGPPPKGDVLKAFRADEYSWAPDPGETSATLGGLASTRAAGPNQLRFGTAGDHISAISAVFANGQEYIIKRGHYKFKSGQLKLPTDSVLDVDPTILGLSQEADLMDLLIGSQGMYCFISGLWLSLSKAKTNIWGLVFFFKTEEKAAILVDKILEHIPETLVSLDFLDLASLKVVTTLRKSANKLKDIPEPPRSSTAAIMMELINDDESLIEKDSIEIINHCHAAGGDPDQSWALVATEVEKMRIFRHSVPEGIGSQIDVIRSTGFPVQKIATDLTRPDLSFSQCLKYYRRDLKEMGLEAIIFGHTKHNHLHINFLPKNTIEAQAASELLAHWLKQAKNADGELFFEHGVGKIKKEYFLSYERKERIKALKLVKETLDPKGLFNPGNLFD